MDVAKAVSQALRNMSRWGRYDTAKKFAARMLLHERRIRDWGCDLPGGKRPNLPRDVINAMCWGVGDEHNRAMIAKYKAARLAAERFCRRHH
jgi:hypothetical protein